MLTSTKAEEMVNKYEVCYYLNVPESSSITTEDKNITLKAYSTQKVGSGGIFESGNQVYGRQE